MKVYIVTANDFPDAAFSTEVDANKYALEQSEKLESLTSLGSRRIYYRVYAMELRSQTPQKGR